MHCMLTNFHYEIPEFVIHTGQTLLTPFCESKPCDCGWLIEFCTECDKTCAQEFLCGEHKSFVVHAKHTQSALPMTAGPANILTVSEKLVHFLLGEFGQHN